MKKLKSALVAWGVLSLATVIGLGVTIVPSVLLYMGLWWHSIIYIYFAVPLMVIGNLFLLITRKRAQRKNNRKALEEAWSKTDY